MAKDLLTVLVTGAGAPGIAGTIRMLKNNPDGREVKVIAADMREDVVGRYIADDFVVVPPGRDRTFVVEILKIAMREGVDVIVPQVTDELLPLARAWRTFRSVGIGVTVSRYENVLQAMDKYELLVLAEQVKLPHPEFYLATNESELLDAMAALNYPEKKVVVRPRISCGMRGLRIISSKSVWDVERFLSEKPDGVDITLADLFCILHRGSWPELVVTEYLPGPEYSVDMFRGVYVTVAFPRLREQIRSGITFQSKAEIHQTLSEDSAEMSGHIDLYYCFGFQWKTAEDGVLKLIECNPRVQGTMVAGAFAGYNFVYHAVAEAAGDFRDNPSVMGIHNGLRFYRYWGGIAVYDGKMRGRV